MGTDALLVVPPFLKVVSGPLLGPAMLLSAGRSAGHRVRLLDLNARWLKERLPAEGARSVSPFVGDHDRPGEILRAAQREFTAICRAELPARREGDLGQDPALSLMFDHDDVLRAARQLVKSDFGRWKKLRDGTAPVRRELRRHPSRSTASRSEATCWRLRASKLGNKGSSTSADGKKDL